MKIVKLTTAELMQHMIKDEAHEVLTIFKKKPLLSVHDQFCALQLENFNTMDLVIFLDNGEKAWENREKAAELHRKWDNKHLYYHVCLQEHGVYEYTLLVM